MRRMQRVLEYLVLAIEGLSSGLLCLLCGVVLLGVLDRFWFSFGWPWPEEAARYLLIWVTFLATALAFRFRAHFVVDALVEFLPEAIRKALAFLVGFIGIAVLMIVTVKGAEMTAVAADQVSPALGLSMAWVYVPIPIGGALSILFLLFPTPQPSSSTPTL